MNRLTHWTNAIGVLFLLTSFAPAQTDEIVLEGPQETTATHSEEMQALLVSPWSDSSDRTFDSLVAVEKALYRAKAEEKALREACVHDDSAALKSDLERSVREVAALDRIRSDVLTVQRNLSDCLDLCSKAEEAAATGQPMGDEHARKMSTYTRTAAQALDSMEKQVGALDSLADKDEQPALRNKVNFLERETKALGDVVSLCESTAICCGDSDGEEGSATKATSDKNQSEKKAATK